MQAARAATTAACNTNGRTGAVKLYEVRLVASLREEVKELRAPAAICSWLLEVLQHPVQATCTKEGLHQQQCHARACCESLQVALHAIKHSH